MQKPNLLSLSNNFVQETGFTHGNVGSTATSNTTYK
jgi:hypothetical protein